MSWSFCGWRIVAVCLVAAAFASALGLSGASVYLHTMTASKGWSTGAVSSSIVVIAARALATQTLPPIIVRREFGAVSFGALYGVASCGIQRGMGLGPGFYGRLHDTFGGYRVPGPVG